MPVFTPPPKKTNKKQGLLNVYGTSCIAYQKWSNFTPKNTICPCRSKKKKITFIYTFFSIKLKILSQITYNPLQMMHGQKLTDTSVFGMKPHGLAIHGFQSLLYNPFGPL